MQDTCLLQCSLHNFLVILVNAAIHAVSIPYLTVRFGYFQIFRKRLQAEICYATFIQVCLSLISLRKRYSGTSFLYLSSLSKLPSNGECWKQQPIKYPVNLDYEFIGSPLHHDYPLMHRVSNLCEWSSCSSFIWVLSSFTVHNAGGNSKELIMYVQHFCGVVVFSFYRWFSNQNRQLSAPLVIIVTILRKLNCPCVVNDYSTSSLIDIP